MTILKPKRRILLMVAAVVGLLAPVVLFIPGAQAYHNLVRTARCFTR